MASSESRFLSTVAGLLSNSANAGHFTHARVLFDRGGHPAPETGVPSRVSGVSIGATANAVYDIASLTKVVSTWFLTGQAIGRGGLTLDSKVGEVLGSPHAPSGGVTVEQILSHQTGLMPSTMLQQYSEPDLISCILAEPLESEPGGSYKYLNRGFILLGACLTKISGVDLRDLFVRDVAYPLGMTNTMFGPADSPNGLVPTSVRPDGTAVRLGHPHDNNADLLGGAAGHAGLFSTDIDLHRFCRAVNSIFRGEGSRFGISDEFAIQSISPIVAHDQWSRRGLAWLTSETEIGLCVFHHGFTGTSLFLFPETQSSLILLTNSVCSNAGRPCVVDLRNDLLALAVREIGYAA